MFSRPYEPYEPDQIAVEAINLPGGPIEPPLVPRYASRENTGLRVCFNLSLGLRAALTGCKSPLHSTGSPTTGLVQGAIYAPSILALAIRPKIKTDSKADKAVSDAE